MSANLGRLALFRARGERIHQEIQDRLDRETEVEAVGVEATFSGAWGQAATQEYLGSVEPSEERPPLLRDLLSKYKGGNPFSWHERQGQLLFLPSRQSWNPRRGSPPRWVPLVIADAWYREADHEALAAQQDCKRPAFDEPEGECRKSAESAAKPRLELVPYDVIEEIAEVLTYGANKYEANNWTRGARWGRYFAALLRHGFAWWRGEDRDPETGFSHLAHVGCNLVFLMSYQRHGWGEDDRFLGPDNKPFTKHDGAT